MRAAIAVAAFAAVAQAIATPDGSTDVVLPPTPGVPGQGAPNLIPGGGGDTGTGTGKVSGGGKTDPTPPGNGGNPTPPGNGGNPTPPGNGGNPTPPGNGGNPTPPGNGGNPTPPGNGGNPTPPGNGGNPTPPGNGGNPTPPSDGGDDTYHNKPTYGSDNGYDSGYKPTGYGSSYNYGSGYSAGSYVSPPPSYSYTPPYSSSYGGSSAVYPPSCAWSKPHPPPAPANCDYGSHNSAYPYPITYPAVGDYGQHTSNIGSDYAPSGYTRPSGAWGFASPYHGESVECNKPYTINHYGLTGKTHKVEIWYGTGGTDCNHYHTITDSCDNTGSYTFTPDQYIPPTGGLYGYCLKFTCNESGEEYYTPQFNFKNDDFYSTCKHPACPSSAPPQITYSQPCACIPPPPPTALVAASSAAASAPCPSSSGAAPATTVVPGAVPAGNATSAQPAAYTGSASGLKASLSLVAGLAAAVALVL